MTLFITLFLFSAAAVSSILGTATHTAQAFTEDDVIGATLKIKVTDAYYADLDGDGLVDDVYVEVEFDTKLAVSSDVANDVYSGTYEYEYDIILELPSGKSYDWEVDFSTYDSKVRIGHNMYNTATEPGYYRTSIDAELEEPAEAEDFTSHVFDPPGSDPGGDVELDWYIL